MMQTSFITLSKIYSGTSQNVQDFNILGTRVGKQKQVLQTLSVKQMPLKRMLQTTGKLPVDWGVGGVWVEGVGWFFTVFPDI